MDLGNKTLTGILRTIAAENVLVGYNTYRNRKGRIIVKISYEEPLSSDHKEDSISQDGFDRNRLYLDVCLIHNANEIITAPENLIGPEKSKIQHRNLLKLPEIQKKLFIVPQFPLF